MYISPMRNELNIRNLMPLPKKEVIHGLLNLFQHPFPMHANFIEIHHMIAEGNQQTTFQTVQMINTRTHMEIYNLSGMGTENNSL